MTVKELQDKHSHGLFATSKDIDSALRYAYMIAETLDAPDKIGFFTSIHIVLNTALAEASRAELKEL